MSIDEVKAYLHEGIENIDDEDFLRALKETMQNKYTPSGELILSDAQMQALDKAEAQLDRGEFYTDKEANALMDKWLEE